MDNIKLTKRQFQILDFICSFRYEHHASPNTAEIAKAIGLSSSRTHNTLHRMREIGVLTRKPRCARTIRVTNLGLDLLHAGNAAELDRLWRKCVYLMAGKKCERCESDTNPGYVERLIPESVLVTRFRTDNGICFCESCSTAYREKESETIEWVRDKYCFRYLDQCEQMDPSKISIDHVRDSLKRKMKEVA